MFPALSIEELRAKWPEWVCRDEKTGCLIWQRGTSAGYGVLQAKALTANKHIRAHRAAYLLFNGPIPRGAHLHHLCENKLCCNPDHLDVIHPSEHSRLHRTGATQEPKTEPVDFRAVLGLEAAAKELAVSEKAVEAARVHLYTLIQEAHKTMPDAHIALIVGISRQRVGQIVERGA